MRAATAATSVGKRGDAAGFRRYVARRGNEEFALVPTHLRCCAIAVNSSFRDLTGRCPRRGRLRAIAACIAVAFGPPAAALGLGVPEVASHLGQPLLLRVPLSIEDDTDFGPQCLRLLNPPDGDVPGLGAGRVSLERGAGTTMLRISSVQPVYEPALRIVLEVGCRQRLRREFTVLLDPPPVVSAPSPAFEFGAPEVLGARGQPLLVNVPIVAGPPLTSECVRAAASDSAAVPRVLNDARVALIERDGRRALRLQTSEPVHDERVRVVVELGCEPPRRHEFAVLLAAPRLAATAETGVKAPPTRPTSPRPQARPAQRAKPAAAPTAVAAAPPRAETAAAGVATATPPAARPAPAAIDRLVLAAPEDERKPLERSAAPDPDLLRQVEALSAEVKQLRAELQAANRRQRELEERRDTAGYTWAAALAAVLLFGLGLLLGRRARADEERAAPPDGAGPLTRILGQSQAERRAAAAPAAAPAAGAAAATEPLTHRGDTAIQVTEIGDTTQVIGELYATYVAPPPPPTRTDPQTKTEIALDLDLGKERTTLLAPQTKTEIAVDIDLGERDTEVARQIAREYERVAGGRVNPDPSTPTGNTTVPMTRGLELDLELPPLSKPNQPESKPNKPE